MQRLNFVTVIIIYSYILLHFRREGGRLFGDWTLFCYLGFNFLTIYCDYTQYLILSNSALQPTLLLLCCGDIFSSVIIYLIKF